MSYRFCRVSKHEAKTIEKWKFHYKFVFTINVWPVRNGRIFPTKTFVNLWLIQYFPTKDVDYFLFTIKPTLIIHRKGLLQVSDFKTFSSALVNNVDRRNLFQFVFENAHWATKSVFRSVYTLILQSPIYLFITRERNQPKLFVPLFFLILLL